MRKIFAILMGALLTGCARDGGPEAAGAGIAAAAKPETAAAVRNLTVAAEPEGEKTETGRAVETRERVTAELAEPLEERPEAQAPAEPEGEKSETGRARAGGPAELAETLEAPLKAPEGNQEENPSESAESPRPSSGLPNEKMSWYFGKNKEHKPPSVQSVFPLAPLGGYYLGDAEQKEIYLTFDEGYENGYTEKILDVLKEKGATAAFFVTKPYVRDNPGLIKRMADEGHLVCNHSVSHKSFPSLSQEQTFEELDGLASYYKEQTGLEMPRFFRPPMGEYSQRTLDIARQMGYKTIFWSFAYMDWVTDKQPAPSETVDRFITYSHNGEIALLHAVSSANAAALPEIIDKMRERGYVFKSLNDLPEAAPQTD
ncbi:MAG: delta-lactam-biosynthetic de-N-acetylase [Clostridiales bacterium]|nr:delta-lactam-biosynthetic de-N-acetylase [Clostridiales bacterium]